MRRKEKIGEKFENSRKKNEQRNLQCNADKSTVLNNNYQINER